MPSLFIPSPTLIRQLHEEVDIDEAAQAALEAAARRAPFDPEDPGPHIRDSFAIEDLPDGGKRLVNETDHSSFVEFGTSEMAAQPYLRPALADAGLHR